MSTLNLDELCKYKTSRKISYYTERLASLMSIVGRKRGQSTYAYTKEIRRALEALVYAIWDKSEELIHDIARANIPGELKAPQLRECFALLLEGLLKKFQEEASDLPMGSRILLMNMLLSSIAEMAQHSLPQGGKIFLNHVFQLVQSHSQNPSRGENI